MTERYETARSRGEASLMLIFPEGTWDSLPSEVRLSRPWYGAEVCSGITAHQCSEIAKQGFCIAAAQASKLAKQSTDNEGDLPLTNPSELPPQHLSLKGGPAKCHMLIPVLEALGSGVDGASLARLARKA